MKGDSTPLDNQRKRKTHSKSRNGCQQCKRRHTRCDECRPQCGQCQRVEDTCSFSAATPDRLPSASNEQIFTIDDMHLLHKMLRSHESPLFSDHEAKEARTVQDHEMTLAFAHPYLLHAKLSITALELFHHDPAKTEYYKQATAHNLAALAYARPHVSRRSQEHSEALFIFSALTSLYAYAEPPLRLLSIEHSHTVDPIRDLLTAFGLARGIVVIMTSNKQNLENVGKPDNSLWPDDRGEVVATLDDEYPQLAQLLDVVSQRALPAHVPELHCALRDLFMTISLLQKNPTSHSSARLIQTWPMHSIDTLFLRLCEAREPVALVILAHYAVMVNMRRELWFFQRWPSMLLKQIEFSLGAEWQSLLVWPKSMIRIDME